jgi:hypothetical protein
MMGHATERLTPRSINEASRSKLQGITELNFEDFSEAEANPVQTTGNVRSKNNLSPVTPKEPIPHSREMGRTSGSADRLDFDKGCPTTVVTVAAQEVYS